MFGLNSSEQKIFDAIVVLPLKHMGFKVYIFGSRARGTHSKFSDIDVMFDTANSLKFDESALARIKENIEESLFPYKVDIVNVDELAASYKEQALKDRVEI